MVYSESNDDTSNEKLNICQHTFPWGPLDPVNINFSIFFDIIFSKKGTNIGKGMFHEER
jgi:hypothetical protein